MDPVSQQIVATVTSKMDKSVQHLADQLRTIRTGRASPALLEGVRVECYGSMMPLNQVANISVPEARQLLVKPYDASLLKEVDRAIQGANLGLTPMSDGKQLRLQMPPLSEEQRKKLVAKVKEICEGTRVALRNERRDGNKAADNSAKEGKISDDTKTELHGTIQEELKKHEARIDDLLKKKTAEVMEG
jgi:ribosome recycling factor